MTEWLAAIGDNQKHKYGEFVHNPALAAIEGDEEEAFD